MPHLIAIRRAVLASVLVCAALTAPARADVTGDMVTFLEAQGYEIELVERTWLGRIRIEATRGEMEREMVIDRTTGEILRDHIYRDDDGPGGFWSEIFGSDGDGRSDRGPDRNGGNAQGADPDDDGGHDGRDDDRDDNDYGDRDDGDSGDTGGDDDD